MNRLSLVRRNFGRRRLRTAFTVASIAATLFGLTLLLSIVATIEMSYQKSVVPRVIVHSASSLAVNLPYTMKDKLKAIPNVVEVLPYGWFGGVWKDPKYFFPQFATDPDKFLTVFPEYEIAPDQLAAWKADRTGAVVGEQLAQRYGLKVGDPMFLQGTIYPIRLELNIRGILKPRDPLNNTGIMLFRHDYMEELLGNPGQIGSFWLRLAHNEDVAPTMRAVDQAFFNSDHETKTETERSFQLQFVSMLGNIRAMALFVGVLAVVSILLIVGNTMAMAVRERTGEFAVMKTLGFTRGDVLGLVLGESVGLSALGGAIGVGGAVALTGAIKAAAQYAPFLQEYHVAASVLAITLGLSLFIGLASGIAPALSSSRIRVVEGLRKVV